jgi:hypothetical protein
MERENPLFFQYMAWLTSNIDIKLSNPSVNPESKALELRQIYIARTNIQKT